jgi:hypothetical protein
MNVRAAASMAAGLAALAVAASPATAAPRLACDAPSHDFGTRDNTETVRHVFRLRNEGDSPLRIERVRACCGATVSFAATNLAAGATADVPVLLSLLGRSGPQRKSLFVVSDDPAQPLFRLQFTGTAVSRIELTPDGVEFGPLDEKRAASRTVVLAARDATTFRVTGVACSSPALAATWRTLEDGKRYEVHVATVPPLPPGFVRGTVRVTTDLPDAPPLEFLATASVDSEVMVAPREIAWAAPGHGGESRLTRYLAIRRRSGAAFRVLAAEPPSDAVTVQVSPLGAHGYRLTVSGPATAGVEGRSLTLHTDIPGLEELIVPFIRGGERP